MWGSGGLARSLRFASTVLSSRDRWALRSPSARAIGDLVDGKYRLVRCVGEGGMGLVYEARTPLGRRVAVKLLRSELAERLELVERFFREARAVSAIRHPRIVDVFDVGWTLDGRLPYIAMEYLPGPSLAQELRQRGAFPIPRALAVVAQVLDGLEAAHAQRIVHRDLKPENVILIPHGIDEEVKVLDFGISKWISVSPVLTEAGHIFGTPGYMSPEQARGSTDIDHRADVYSAGALLYELITGVRPYSGPPLEILARIEHDDPLPIGSLRSDVPLGIVRAVERAMCREPSDRWPSAAAMRAALAQARRAFAQGQARTAHPQTCGARRITPVAWEVTRVKRRSPARNLSEDITSPFRVHEATAVALRARPGGETSVAAPAPTRAARSRRRPSMPDLRWVLPCVAIAVFVSALIGGAFVDLGPAGAPARVGDSATLYGRRVPDDGRTAGLAAVAACAGTGDTRGNPPRARLARGRICEGSPGLGGQVAPEDQPTGLFLELVDAVSTFRDFVGFPAAGSDVRP